ncbi:MAG: ribonuclease P protein component [Bacteriovoracaceae bacterium]
MNQSFNKSFRLRTKDDFAQMRKKSRRFHTSLISLTVKKNDLGCSRLGFAVTRKAGKANIRNVYKRVFREWFRTSEFKDQNLDILIVAKKKIDDELKATLWSEIQHIEKYLRKFCGR